MPRPNPTDHERAPVEILDGRLAHHREATLQLGQISPAEDFVWRPRATRHNAGFYQIRFLFAYVLHSVKR